MPSIKLRSNVTSLVQLLPTVKEAQLAKQGLRQLRDAYLFKHQGQTVTLQDSVQLQELGVTEVLLRWLQSPDGKTVLEDFKANSDALIKELEKQLDGLPTIQLTLAYHPSSDDLVRFHTWFTSITGKPLLLDVQYDASLIAGFTAMIGSHFVDNSIKKQLPEIEQKASQLFSQLTKEPDTKKSAPNAATHDLIAQTT